MNQGLLNSLTEAERMLVAGTERDVLKGLDEDELLARVNEHWTVAAVFGHIAFWDARMLALADKLERGDPFSPSDAGRCNGVHPWPSLAST